MSKCHASLLLVFFAFAASLQLVPGKVKDHKNTYCSMFYLILTYHPETLNLFQHYFCAQCKGLFHKDSSDLYFHLD